jgi:hypothetical protein
MLQACLNGDRDRRFSCRDPADAACGRLFNQLPVWAPDAAIRKTILVDNPARPYGF